MAYRAATITAHYRRRDFSLSDAISPRRLLARPVITHTPPTDKFATKQFEAAATVFYLPRAI